MISDSMTEAAFKMCQSFREGVRLCGRDLSLLYERSECCSKPVYPLSGAQNHCVTTSIFKVSELVLSNLSSLSGMLIFLVDSVVHFPIQQKGLWEQEEEEDQFGFCLAAYALKNAEIRR